MKIYFSYFKLCVCLSACEGSYQAEARDVIYPEGGVTSILTM